MKIRVSHSSRFENDNEHGVFCKCGNCLFFDKKDITPPETLVVCPVCNSRIIYCCSDIERIKKGGA